MKPKPTFLPESLGPREILFGIVIFILIIPYFGLFGGNVEMESEEIENNVTEYGVTEEELPSEDLSLDQDDLGASEEDQEALDDVNELLEKARRARGKDK